MQLTRYPQAIRFQGNLLDNGKPVNIFAATLLNIIAVALLAVSTVIYTGTFNVATVWQDLLLLRWMMGTTRVRSIEHCAQTVQIPALVEKMKESS